MILMTPQPRQLAGSSTRGVHSQTTKCDKISDSRARERVIQSDEVEVAARLTCRSKSPVLRGRARWDALLVRQLQTPVMAVVISGKLRSTERHSSAECPG
jgi:hypothetical protein